MKRGTRILLGTVLSISMLLAGLIIGMWGSGTFLVERNAGLAGAAEVIWYGLLGAAVTGIIGVLLSRNLSGRSLVGNVCPRLIRLRIKLSVPWRIAKDGVIREIRL